jgi:hypothetical protein
MNERIKELAEQARIEEYGEFDKQLFAELIINECASIALREEHDPYECILKHFGIDSVSNQLRKRSTYFGNNP